MNSVTQFMISHLDAYRCMFDSDSFMDYKVIYNKKMVRSIAQSSSPSA